MCPRMWKLEARRKYVCRKWRILPILIGCKLLRFVLIKTRLCGHWHLVRRLFLTSEYDWFVIESIDPRSITICTWPILPSLDCTYDDVGNKLCDVIAYNRCLGCFICHTVFLYIH